MMDLVLKHIPEIAMTAAMAWGAGLRMYLVVFVVGLAGYFGYVPLPDTMKIISHPAVMGAAGLMAFIEFFADKIPYLDSMWDGIHTFLRIPAGAALAAGMMGGNGDAVSMVAAILGGTLAAGTHFGKAGTRAVVNTSPEPFSNVGTSLAEEGMLLGGLGLAMTSPWLFLALLAVFIVAVIILLGVFIRAIRKLMRRKEASGTLKPI
jgi:Domain of unknown function (DUF4126)